ncbi:YhcH/YjgK/YiaL family protein [Photobacterium nomapromontoriensis]|uniref:YhcH/YjgK/YiaL family protein n=1 Tax=Photobacterium nomapromontoriensis TaxID=2910237 RepID=UPI003D0CD57D
MILGHINDKNLKYNLPSKIWDAIEIVREHGFDKLENGITKFRDDLLYINVMTVDSVSKESKSCEVHNYYTDVQILLEGEELMEFTTDSIACKPVTDYDEINDFQLVDPIDSISTCILKPNMFAVYFPGEPHKPTCFINEAKTIRKAVIKIHNQLLHG